MRYGGFSGLYIHIPFCEVICPYCDFATWKDWKRNHPRWLEAVKKEILLRSEVGAAPQTVYLGGGTPSRLPLEELSELFQFLQAHLDLKVLEEVTMECNPNDLSEAYVQGLKLFGITRLSVGIQSFQPRLLNKLGRAHDAATARNSLTLLKEAEIEFNLDLMFGLPHQNLKDWKNDVEEALSFQPHHFSLYGLTIEEGTLFDRWTKKGKLPAQMEDLYANMYLHAAGRIEEAGLQRYEISNFSKPDLESKHNRNYWRHENYLGVGPGAHSLLQNKRSANSKKFPIYERWVLDGCLQPSFFQEDLSLDTLYRESLWLGLRTTDGIDLNELEKKFQRSPPLEKLQPWLEQELLEEWMPGRFRPMRRGWLLVDEMSVQLF